MRFTVTSAVLAAGAMVLAGPGLAQPVEKAARNDMQERAAAGGGGLGTILSDHFKYVANPPSAKIPIPAEENNAAREAHRDVHAALFDALGGGKGGGKGAGKAPAEKPDAGKEEPAKEKKPAEEKKPAKEDPAEE